MLAGKGPLELYWKKGFAQAITPLISLWQTNYLNSVNKTKLLSFTLPPKQLILFNPRQQLDLYPWCFHTQAFSFYKWQAKWVSTSHRGLSTSILGAHTEFKLFHFISHGHLCSSVGLSVAQLSLICWLNVGQQSTDRCLIEFWGNCSSFFPNTVSDEVVISPFDLLKNLLPVFSEGEGC